jgi:hypothetical protein
MLTINDYTIMYAQSNNLGDRTNQEKQYHLVQTAPDASNIISKQVFYKRRDEIFEYLQLFGYKPDSTIIQVHITGFFHKKAQISQKEKERHISAVKRYGGTSFVVLGRTHDPSIMKNVTKPRNRNASDTSPGYIGYLWKNKDVQKRSPHEVIPLDFVPIHLPYPADWKKMFATKGFMLALHVPASFARYKNRLTRELYRIAKTGVNVKNQWTFLNEIIQLGSNNIKKATTYSIDTVLNANQTEGTRTRMNYSVDKNITENDDAEDRDPLKILKRRLANDAVRSDY